jgi:hypothetical protein
MFYAVDLVANTATRYGIIQLPSDRVPQVTDFMGQQ